MLGSSDFSVQAQLALVPLAVVHLISVHLTVVHYAIVHLVSVHLTVMHFAVVLFTDTVFSSISKQEPPPAKRLQLTEGSEDS